MTNSEYLSFVQSGGYSKPEYWRPEDWEWKERFGLKHPIFWKPNQNSSKTEFAVLYCENKQMKQSHFNNIFGFHKILRILFYFVFVFLFTGSDRLWKRETLFRGWKLASFSFLGRSNGLCKMEGTNITN